MTSSSTWWQRFGAALFALVLAVLTFGPGLDAIVCRDESGLNAAAAEHVAVAATQADVSHFDAKTNTKADLSDHGADGSACIHGHCHHGASCVPAEVRLADGVQALRLHHELSRSRVIVSDPKFALKRPPRG
jgi:hypothetical protein